MSQNCFALRSKVKLDSLYTATRCIAASRATTSTSVQLVIRASPLLIGVAHGCTNHGGAEPRSMVLSCSERCEAAQTTVDFRRWLNTRRGATQAAQSPLLPHVPVLEEGVKRECWCFGYSSHVEVLRESFSNPVASSRADELPMASCALPSISRPRESINTPPPFSTDS